jgi:phosphopantothenoylcysteine decarboxylase/phosphopantothenate--cysteine ligase
MGFALAEACAMRGAAVMLVSGPVALTANHPNITQIDVESADEMFEAAIKAFPYMDAAILCAAVADYRPQEQAAEKIKRTAGNLTINLVPNKDIAAELGVQKKNGQILVGFALETNDEEQNALKKIKKKNLNFIVLNSLNDAGAGFRHDTNKITIIGKDRQKKEFPLKSKKEAANDIVDATLREMENEKLICHVERSRDIS